MNKVPERNIVVYENTDKFLYDIFLYKLYRCFIHIQKNNGIMMSGYIYEIYNDLIKIKLKYFDQCEDIYFTDIKLIRLFPQNRLNGIMGW